MEQIFLEAISRHVKNENVTDRVQTELEQLLSSPNVSCDEINGCVVYLTLAKPLAKALVFL